MIQTLYLLLTGRYRTPLVEAASKSAGEKKKGLKIHSATLKYNLHTQLCTVRHTLRAEELGIGVSQSVEHSGVHTCTQTLTYTHSLTTHHCPLINTSFHGHPHSLSPSLLHTPVILPSFSAPPHSSTPPLSPSIHCLLHPPPLGFYLFFTAACPLIFFTPHSLLTFLSCTLIYCIK